MAKVARFYLVLFAFPALLAFSATVSLAQVDPSKVLIGA